MAHLGSTSLFGLYLAMGGILALSQRQCILGQGVCLFPYMPSHFIGSIMLNFDWTFKVEENVTGQIKRGRSCVSPFCFREELSAESTRVCHAVENTHNIPMMWHYPRNFILLPWPDVYSLFPSGSAHWSLWAILKEEAA